MNIKVRKTRADALIPIRASDGADGYDVFASRVLDKVTKEVIRDLPVEIPPRRECAYWYWSTNGGALAISMRSKTA